MCTVTFIPSKNGFFLTSSRDEQAGRITFPPAIYSTGDTELVYPKDQFAGGTWIAADMKGKIACLLNGAFVKHEKRNKYNKSRGLILLESFQYSTAEEFSEKVILENIEPFTLVLLDYTKENALSFFEFRWDGERKYLKQLNTDECQIWSSCTLYTSEVQTARKDLFQQWLDQNREFEDCNISAFHNKKHGLKSADDILMKGEGDLMTLSISQIHVALGNSKFKYDDLLQNKKYNINLKLTENV